MNWSASVVLDDVDDYLAPSQACVNPLFQTPIKKHEDEKTQTKTNKVVPRRRRRRAPISDERKSSPTTETFTGPKAEGLPLEKAGRATASEQIKDSIVKASIADCLACSGCVTTAETVLLEERHSLRSLRQKLQSSQRKFRAITISPNSWADFCRHWNLPSAPLSNGTKKDWNENENTRGVDPIRLQFTTLLNQILNADIVVDGNLPLQWTWLGEAHEFVELYRTRRRNIKDLDAKDEEHTSYEKCGKRKDSPLPSTAVNATKSTYYYPDGSAETVDNANDEHDKTAPPLISGSCPATVCLVEKSRSKLVPHLSRTQSPMSMMGSVLKGKYQVQHETNHTSEPSINILWDHWAIMPCHDKKIEASRQDFVLPYPKRSLVDLVITTSECVELVEEFVQLKDKEGSHNNGLTIASYLQGLPLATMKRIASCRDVPEKPSVKPTYLTTLGSNLNARNNHANNNDSSLEGSSPFALSSGSHANFIFSYAARELFGCAMDKVEWKAANVVQEVNNDTSDNRRRVIKSARLARAQKQHYFKAQLFRREDGGYSQTQPASLPESPVLEFYIAHGMQTMQRALKEIEDLESSPNSSNGDHKNGSTLTMRYLEAMACPNGGCINGGGAISTRNTSNGADVRETPTETRQRIQKSLQVLDIPHHPSSDALLLNDSSPALNTSAHDSSLYTQSSTWSRTRYHVVPQMKHTLGATAGVKTEDIQW